ncbi:hypothetical protein BDQ17DRAFT_201910 [Cyathus striatus]|nr:hypothetical protein BDQ17DRAFT_201910 [Cyathus striatus]
METTKQQKRKPNTTLNPNVSAPKTRHVQDNANTASNNVQASTPRRSGEAQSKVEGTRTRNRSATPNADQSKISHHTNNSGHESVQTPDKPRFTVEQLKNADASRLKLGNVVGISGLDTRMMKELGLGVDDMLKLYDGVMERNLKSGKEFSVKQGEGLHGTTEGQSREVTNFYGASGVGYNPHGSRK